MQMHDRYPRSLPPAHRAFLDHALPVLATDRRLLGVAAAGSYATDRMDAYSDLDLVLCGEAGDQPSLLNDRMPLAASLGGLLGAFTGEHVGEPRLLICLYGPPPLHVDLKFVAIDDLAARVDEPAILWQREDRLTRALGAGVPRYPQPDAQWIEDRFWIWIHYVATKVGRGELQEAVEFLSYLRVTVLGPLALRQAGLPPAGVRRLEADAPAAAAELAATVVRPERPELVGALRRAVAMYRRLRAADAAARVNVACEAAACAFLDEVAVQFGA